MIFSRLAGLKSRAKAPLEMVVIHRLGKIAHYAVLQGEVAHRLIGICGDEDRRDRVSRLDEVLVELDARHSRHLDIGNQAVGFRYDRRFEEIGRRRERFDGVTEQRHELSHGLAKRLIILDDRYQRTFRHGGFPVTLLPAIPASKRVARLHPSW